MSLTGFDVVYGTDWNAVVWKDGAEHPNTNLNENEEVRLSVVRGQDEGVGEKMGDVECGGGK